MKQEETANTANQTCQDKQKTSLFKDRQIQKGKCTEGVKDREYTALSEEKCTVGICVFWCVCACACACVGERESGRRQSYEIK